MKFTLVHRIKTIEVVDDGGRQVLVIPFVPHRPDAMQKRIMTYLEKKQLVNGDAREVEDDIDEQLQVIIYNYDIDLQSKGKQDAELANPDAQQPAGSQKRKKSDALVDLILANTIEVFMDQYDEVHICVNNGGKRKTMRINSSAFRRYCSNIYFQETESGTTDEQFKEAISTIEGKVYGQQAARKQLFLRVAGNIEDAIYYDLSNEDEECVKITKDGWKIEQAPTIFFRYKTTDKQVKPLTSRGKEVSQFFDIMNYPQAERMLAEVAFISYYIPKIVHPISQVIGSHGSAKSTAHKLQKQAIDPSVIDRMSLPRDINEFVQQNAHNAICVYNNLSELKDWQSDAFCTAIEGGGLLKRTLFSNDEDTIMKSQTAIFCNGIEQFMTKADVLDRTLTFHFERIEKKSRRTEKQILKEFNERLPYILGEVFDIIAKVMAEYKPTDGNVELERLADFHEIGRIIAKHLGYTPEAFDLELARVSSDHALEVVQNNQIAEIIVMFSELHKDGYGPAKMKDILTELTELAKQQGYRTDAKSNWPQSSKALGNKIASLRVSLAEVGVKIQEIGKDANKSKLYTIAYSQRSDDSPNSPILRQGGHETETEKDSEKPSENNSEQNDSPKGSPTVHETDMSENSENNPNLYQNRAPSKQRAFNLIFDKLADENEERQVDHEQLKRELITSGKFDAGEAHQIIKDNLATNTIYETLPGKYKKG